MQSRWFCSTQMAFTSHEFATQRQCELSHGLMCPAPSAVGPFNFKIIPSNACHAQNAILVNPSDARASLGVRCIVGASFPSRRLEEARCHWVAQLVCLGPCISMELGTLLVVLGGQQHTIRLQAARQTIYAGNSRSISGVFGVVQKYKHHSAGHLMGLLVAVLYFRPKQAVYSWLVHCIQPVLLLSAAPAHTA
jgi:hypothetical protein